jgi:hypothetical protein
MLDHERDHTETEFVPSSPQQIFAGECPLFGVNLTSLPTAEPSLLTHSRYRPRGGGVAMQPSLRCPPI